MVRPKKSLGQHFLTDLHIAQKIVSSISDDAVNVVEIGPGKGVLSQYLLQNNNLNMRYIETDRESVEYLK
jgi:16S rRNA (adenine1518-N6/adenine1519-N6)-dimethyltransferase